MKKLLSEFKDFINKGNVMDLAVAVVIGGAFTAIVNSIVNDIIMPLISLCTGGIDFTEMKIPIGSSAAFTYGNLISALLQFIIIALVVFLIVKALNTARKKFEKPVEEEPEVPAPTCPFCLEEVKEGATRCPHCAGEFAEPAKAPVPAAAEEAAE